jgi:hypothetical protein
MNINDKSILLFETLMGVSDSTLVNYKINEIQASPEYKRLSTWISSASSSQLLDDVIKRFNAINIYAITSFEEALKIQQELIDLDRRVTDFTGVNPYLSNGSEKQYKVRTLGSVGVEINARGIKLDEFASNKNVSRINRRKVIVMKAYNWYREAKVVLKNMQEELKSLVSRVRASRLRFSSLDFECTFTNLMFVLISALFFFGTSVNLSAWRSGELNELHSIILFGLFVGLGFATLFINTLHTKYKVYSYHVSSIVRKQIVNQEGMLQDLEKKSVKLEQDLARLTTRPKKIKISLDNVSVVKKYSRQSTAEILDFIYSENDHFYQKNRAILIFMHILFIMALICVAGISALLILL